LISILTHDSPFSFSNTVTLYNDIINLFVYLLKAIGEEKEH